MISARIGQPCDEDQGPWAGWMLAAAVVVAAHAGAVVVYLALHRPSADLAAAPIVTVEFAPPSAELPSQAADGAAPEARLRLPYPFNIMNPADVPNEVWQEAQAARGNN